MALSIEQFQKHLTASGLFSAADVSSFLDTIPDGQRLKDGEALARELVRQKKLTKYQAEQLYAGKGNSLTLGNYVILDKLGQGGMGMVLKAKHLRMGRIVALKVMSPAAVKSKDAVKRFHREVQAAAKLTHQNIVTAFDADEAKGTHFLVMEYVEGDDLSQLVKKHGAMSVEQAIECVLQAARGLEHAHQNGVIHRDIKPANLLLDKNGTVKILDMGLARLESGLSDAAGVSSAGLTQSGTIMGTVDYMSPEQAEDTRHADARADIYSLGCSLFYLLTGQVVYGGQTMMKKLLAHRDAAIPSLVADAASVGSVASNVRHALDTIFRKMVAKRPGDRQQSMGEVIADLERCRSGEGVTVSFEGDGAESGSSFELQKFLRQISGEEGSQVTSATSGPLGTNELPVNATAETVLLTTNSSGTDPQTEMTLAGERSRSIGKVWQGRNGLLAIVGVVVLVLGGWWMFGTPRGMVQIEIADEQIAVTLGETGRTLRGMRTETVKLPVGEHVLHVHIGETTLDTPEVEVAKGKLVEIKVEKVGNRVRVMRGKEFLVAKELPRSKVAGVKNTANAGSSSDAVQNYALEFDGTDDYVDIPSLQPVKGESRTVECWISNCRPSPRYRVFDMAGDGAALALDCVPLGSPADQANWTVFGKPSNAPNTGFYSAVHPIPIARQHLAVVFGDRSIHPTLFVNGKPLDGPKKAFGFKLPSSMGTLLGAHRGDNSKLETFFNGRLHQIRVSHSVRYSREFTPPDRFAKDADTLALYHFDEGQGSELKDSSGNKHHGKIVGAKWVKVGGAPMEDVVNRALRFDGVGQFVTANVSLPIEKPWTLEGWATPQKAPPMNEMSNIIGGDLIGLSFKELPLRGLRWQAYYPGAREKDRAYQSELSTELNHPAHLAVVHDGESITLFVNGVPQGQPRRFRPKPGDTTVTLGPSQSSAGSGQPGFYGILDEVRISSIARYKEAFTPARRFEPDQHTLALLHFDEGQGDKLNDSSGNNHHGKIVGAKWMKVDLRSEISNFKSQSSDPASPYDLWTSSDYEWSKPENLGAVVNSNSDEASPCLSADGLTFLFESGRAGGQGAGDLWMCKRATLTAPWSAPENLGPKVNSNSSDTNPSLSADGLTLAFASDRAATIGEFRIWLSTRAATADPWSSPKRLEATPAVAGASDGGPEQSADGLSLYFHSRGRPGSGKHDLWVCRRANTSATWGAPENLGPTVNNAEDDTDPAHSSDGRVLVFSSKRGNGRLNELWWSSRPSLDAPWSAAQQIGSPIQSAFESFRATLSTDGQTMLFTSYDRTGGQGKNDLWQTRRVLTPAAAARAAAANTFTNSLGMEFVRVPKGKSWLGGGGGKPGTQEVTISEDFYLGKFEVTQGEWEVVMDGSKPSYFRPGATGGELVKGMTEAERKRLPVENVSWDDAQEFLRLLNTKAKDSGWQYRLPTASEWEYAARGGPLTKPEESAFHFYFDQPTNTLTEDQAAVKASQPRRPRPVGSYSPNRLGLFDMHGNVREWSVTEHPNSGGKRATRSGGWSTDAPDCRASRDYSELPTAKYYDLGLRVARVPIAGQWQPLFNGKDLTGWKFGNPNQTKGTDVVQHEGQPAIRMATKAALLSTKFENFHVRLEFKADAKRGPGLHVVRLDGDKSNCRVSLKLWKLLDAQRPTLLLGTEHCAYQLATIRDGQIVANGEVRRHQSYVQGDLGDVPPPAADGWQRLEIVRLGDALAFVVNGKLSGAIANVRHLDGETEKPIGPSVLELWEETGAGNVYWRNLEVREIQSLPPEVVGLAEWQPLFNGKDLTGLKQRTANGIAEVVVEDGQPILKLQNRSNLTTRRFGDYHLRLEFRPEKGSKVRPFSDSVSAQLMVNLEDDLSKANLNGTEMTYEAATISSGRFVGNGQTIDSHLHPYPDPLGRLTFKNATPNPNTPWQRLEIIRLGDSCAVLLNGQLVAAATNIRITRPGEPAKAPGQTEIGLTAYGGPASYRNIEIREITALPPEIAP